MTDFSLFTSLPVRKIVKGDTLSLYFSTNGVALFQGVNPDTGVPIPTWDATTGPAITPHVGSARGNNYTLESHKWVYNGNDLKFSTSGSGWETSSVDNRFRMNHADGTIQIIGNLASKSNEDADTLEYSGVARQSEQVVYEVQKTVDIFISPLGSSGFGGGVSLESEALGVVNHVMVRSTRIIDSSLFNANGAVSDYTIKVYKGLGGDELASLAHGKENTFNITRDMVDGQQVFIVKFFIPGNTEAVYTTGFTITDFADLYQPKAYMEGQPSDDGDVGIVKGYVYNVRTNTEATVSKGTVIFKLVNSANSSLVMSKSLTYKEFKDTGVTITGANLTDSDNNTISASANIQMDVTIG